MSRPSWWRPASSGSVGSPSAKAARVRFGIRLHVITRDKASDAWAETERLLEQMDDDVIALAQQGLEKSESVGQQRMRELHGGTRESTGRRPEPLGRHRAGAGRRGTALVGDHDEVAERIAEYHALGFEEFILSGHPHVEEAYWVGEHVRPRLVAAGLVADDGADRAAPKLNLSAISAR